MVTMIVNYDTSQSIEVEPIEIESVGNGEVLVDVSREEAIQLLHALEEFDRQYE